MWFTKTLNAAAGVSEAVQDSRAAATHLVVNNEACPFAAHMWQRAYTSSIIGCRFECLCLSFA